MVLEEEIWNEISEANRRGIEAAADGLGLAIDEQRSRLRVAAQEKPNSCAIIVDEAEEGMMRKITDVDRETVAVNAAREPLEDFSSQRNADQERMEGSPSRKPEEKNKSGSFQNFGRNWK